MLNLVNFPCMVIYIYVWFICKWMVYLVLLNGIILSLSRFHASVHLLTHLLGGCIPTRCRNQPFYSSCLEIRLWDKHLELSGKILSSQNALFHGCYFILLFIYGYFFWLWLGACLNWIFVFFWLEAFMELLYICMGIIDIGVIHGMNIGIGINTVGINFLPFHSFLFQDYI